MIEYFTLGMQIAVLITVAGGAWYAALTQKAARDTLNALTVYRREVEWMTARLEALEQKEKGQVNGRVEASRAR
jgi:hypothetical protein